MTTFIRAPMPRANEWVSADGSLTAPALNYLGNIEKMLSVLVDFNGADAGFIGSVRQAASVEDADVVPVFGAYTRAGANYLTAEVTAALDEIRDVDFVELSANDRALETSLNQVIAALKAAGIMGA